MNKAAKKFEKVDEEIYACLSIEKPKSFYVFAGAGSGKTGSLVKVLERFKNEQGQLLKRQGKQVAVITYTNAACDEIKRRLKFDSTFNVSTIHSFAWELIKPYQKDIKSYVRKEIIQKIADLEEKLAKAKNQQTKTYIENEQKKLVAESQLSNLDDIKKFNYSPSGNNFERDALNHAQVIAITAEFINTPLIQRTLTQRFPILLIDECQDTNAKLMTGFFNVQQAHENHFVLGLFGDVMQRIYLDGMKNLIEKIPGSWEKPVKEWNYRSPKRVVQLINQIRLDDDGLQQTALPDKEEGSVRLFLIDCTSQQLDKASLESYIFARMAELTGDESWEHSDLVKVLTLEHKMAAKRGGFFEFFSPLSSLKKDYTGLLDGSLPEISFLKEQVFSLVNAGLEKDAFQVARVVKKYSPMLKKQVLKEVDSPLENLQLASNAVNQVLDLWRGEPLIWDVVKLIKSTGLFELPKQLASLVEASDIYEALEMQGSDGDEDRSKYNVAWENALNVPFSQLEKYFDYISDNSGFGTHQGVKGLEFERVMVVLDDEDAGGNLFSYEKLLGVKDLSDTDKQNIEVGNDNSPARTRRLFYVTCSRAEKSLVVVAYTANPQKVKDQVLGKYWFNESEIILM